MKTAIISTPAFLSMVISSIEVFKKETFGILVGSKIKNNYYVNYAINFQSATRHYDYIEMDMKRINRINSILKYLVKQKVIGDFHSHAEGLFRLSEHDVKELKEEGPNFLSILIVVTKKKKSYRWKYEKGHQTVSGSLGTFYVKICVNDYNSKKKKVVPVKIKLRNLHDLNKISRYYEKLWEKLEKYHKKEREAKKRKQKLKQKLKIK